MYPGPIYNWIDARDSLAGDSLARARIFPESRFSVPANWFRGSSEFYGSSPSLGRHGDS